MSKYIISQAASQDLDDICDYFASRSIEAGERFVTAFNQKCKNLVKFPHIGRSYDLVSPGLRGISLDGYIIFYQLISDSIEIVRVVSGYRDLPSLLSEK